jgi:hypothetical protein
MDAPHRPSPQAPSPPHLPSPLFFSPCLCASATIYPLDNVCEAKGLSAAETTGTALAAAKAEPIAIEIIFFLLSITFSSLECLECCQCFCMPTAATLHEHERCRTGDAMRHWIIGLEAAAAVPPSLTSLTQVIFRII